VWPTLDEAFGDYAVRMNTIPKHVASRTLTETTWNATLLEGDVVDAVRELKEQPGGDILKVGTGSSFSRTLLERRLVDEYLFWPFPVFAGSGERLYDAIDPTDFDLIDVKRLDNSILGLTYVRSTRYRGSITATRVRLTVLRATFALGLVPEDAIAWS
jgi:dihydrofolate reductase